MSTIIKNPVLRGFNPDPSMIFVDGVYYIATSTFEWFPGVQIHKSVDLVNWDLASRPLNRVSLLDLKGNPPSTGVWAPCLSYADGMFYLVYANVKNWNDPFKDTYNYITTCETVDGEWSEPVFVNGSGFDASLFHDEDGKKYFINMEWDHRKNGADYFSGILIQEWDHTNKKLIGKQKKIFTGTKRGLVEGPHIYKKDDFYYLFCAEGGTDENHAESVGRSLDVFGPYEVHPNELLISSLGSDAVIQKAGHGSICMNDKGEWYLAHLCGRYLEEKKVCPLGRETSIQQLIWVNNWPYLKSMKIVPEDEIVIDLDIEKRVRSKRVYTFSNDDFLRDFQTLRTPYNLEQFNLTKRTGYLTIKGYESPYSMHKQSVLARRQEDFKFNASTTLDFQPTYFQEMAGLVYRYNEDNQYFLYITYDEEIDSKVLNVMTSDSGNIKYLDNSIEIGEGLVTLGVEVEGIRGNFYYEINGTKVYLDHVIDVSILSDEYANPMGFTGAFIGMLVVDIRFHSKEAYYQNFVYEGLDK